MARTSRRPSWRRRWVLEVGRIWVYYIGMVVRAFQAKEAKGVKARDSRAWDAFGSHQGPSAWAHRRCQGAGKVGLSTRLRRLGL